MTKHTYFRSVFLVLPFLISLPTFAQTLDTDNDGMPDAWEIAFGLDPNFDLDASQDLDGDTVTNLVEFQSGSRPDLMDSDFDGYFDDQDIAPGNYKIAQDSDADGLPDVWEMSHGLNENDPADANDTIHDSDSLTVLQEYVLGTDHHRDDTDGDGVSDGIDAFPLNAQYQHDSDADGLPDAYEMGFYFLDPNSAFDATLDHEGDGLNNLAEFMQGTHPDNPDSDLDFTFDGDDIEPLDRRYAMDLDGDAMPDEWEVLNGLATYYDDRWQDNDFDYLSNQAEYLAGTDPMSPDSDNDGMLDGDDRYPLEMRYQFDYDRDGLPQNYEYDVGLNDSDAMDASFDYDGDLLTNLSEYLLGTDPNQPDTDLDGVIDGEDLFPTDRTKARDLDLDGLPDSWEVINGLDAFYEGDAQSYGDDFDNLNVLQEYRLGTDYTRSDTDGDGVNDDVDLFPLDGRYHSDFDQDGLPEAYEYEMGFNDSDPYDSVQDNDDDGLANIDEFRLGTDPWLIDSDNDFVLDGEDIAPANPNYAFDDNDNGLPDEWESENYVSGSFGWEDNDFDGLTNAEEYELDTDPINPDTDADGVYDGHEHFPLDNHYRFDSDRDGMPDFYEQVNGLVDGDTYDGSYDYDYDGLNNSQEFFAGTSINNPDTDMDGVQDGEDLFPTDPTIALDSDQDGLPDSWEIIRGFDPYYPNGDSYEGDTDNLTLLEEYQLGTDYLNNDTDGDGVDDHLDVFPLDSRYQMDSDSDGLPDAYEMEFGFSPGDPSDAGLDQELDGLSNLEEFLAGTNPTLSDSDLDGVPDGSDLAPTNSQYGEDLDGFGLPDEWEQEYGVSNLPWEDLDGDGLTSLQEYQRGTDPSNPDTDNDGEFDGYEHYPLDPQYRFDSDRDGMPDLYEQINGLSYHFTDDGGFDNDNDDLNNSQEYFVGTDVNQPDSDFDGVQDGEDLYPTDRALAQDSDLDGLPDAWEVVNGLDPFFEGDGSADDDFDGLSNLEEFLRGTDVDNADSDSDGVMDDVDEFPTDVRYHMDSDLDGMADAFEFEYGLMAFDPQDASWDFDADGLSNLEEFERNTLPDQFDTDMDGYDDSSDIEPNNPLYNLDADNNLLPDTWESQYGVYGFYWEDFDGDGLSNLREYQLGTNPAMTDTDADGFMDNEDHFPLNFRFGRDSDRDTMPDAYEMYFGLSSLDTYDGMWDGDGDGLINVEEYRLGTLHYLHDSDFDGYSDGQDAFPTDPSLGLDSDADGLADSWEILNGLDPSGPTDAESLSHDADGLSVIEEYRLGTDFTLDDTDGDGVLDDLDIFPLNASYSMDYDQDGLPAAYEAQYSFLDDNYALDAMTDHDGDGLSQLQEFEAGTDAGIYDSDSDGVSDGEDVLPTDDTVYLDSDRDGLPDEWEMEYGSDPYRVDDFQDVDQDYLSNRQEYELGITLASSDTDNDGIPDGQDRYPLNADYSSDFDQDGIAEAWEVARGFSDYDTSDALLDLDGNGQNNLEEFLAGLNTPPSIELTQSTVIGGQMSQSGFGYVESTNTYSMAAEGSNLGGWVDHAYYVYELVQGDVDIRVRMAHIDNNWAAGGIMIRQTLDFGSPFAANIVEKAHAGHYVRRFQEYTPAPTITEPTAQEGSWLRLQKVGDVITHSVSGDGATWVEVGSDTYAMGDSFYVGLVGMSVESSPVTIFTFEDVYIGATQ